MPEKSAIMYPPWAAVRTMWLSESRNKLPGCQEGFQELENDFQGSKQDALYLTFSV
jgi:hypothetical protein